LVGKPEGRPRRRKKNNIKMDDKETEFYGVIWSHLGENMTKFWAVVNTVMNLRVT
jgi:hypothetical protein